MMIEFDASDTGRYFVVQEGSPLPRGGLFCYIQNMKYDMLDKETVKRVLDSYEKSYKMISVIFGLSGTVNSRPRKY